MATLSGVALYSGATSTTVLNKRVLLLRYAMADGRLRESAENKGVRNEVFKPLEIEIRFRKMKSLDQIRKRLDSLTSCQRQINIESRNDWRIIDIHRRCFYGLFQVCPI